MDLRILSLTVLLLLKKPESALKKLHEDEKEGADGLLAEHQSHGSPVLTSYVAKMDF